MLSASPRQTTALVIALGLCLSGCGRPASYAALLPRPTELTNDAPTTAQAVTKAPSVKLSAEATAMLVQQLGQAKKGDADFRAALATQQKAIEAAHRAPAMSEVWISAQEGLSLLESVRAPTIEARTQLDAAYLEARKTGIGLDEVARVRADVVVVIDRQNERLRALSTSLSQIGTAAH